MQDDHFIYIEKKRITYIKPKIKIDKVLWILLPTFVPYYTCKNIAAKLEYRPLGIDSNPKNDSSLFQKHTYLYIICNICSSTLHSVYVYNSTKRGLLNNYNTYGIDSTKSKKKKHFYITSSVEYKHSYNIYVQHILYYLLLCELCGYI